MLVPGLNDSGPDNWESRRQFLHAGVERLKQERWDTPDLEEWFFNLEQAMRRWEKPAVVVANSFGCRAAVYCAHQSEIKMAAALLVTPADPEKLSPSGKLSHIWRAFPALLVGSKSAPVMDGGDASIWAAPLSA